MDEIIGSWQGFACSGKDKEELRYTGHPGLYGIYTFSEDGTGVWTTKFSRKEETTAFIWKALGDNEYSIDGTAHWLDAEIDPENKILTTKLCYSIPGQGLVRYCYKMDENPLSTEINSQDECECRSEFCEVFSEISNYALLKNFLPKADAATQVTFFSGAYFYVLEMIKKDFGSESDIYRKGLASTAMIFHFMEYPDDRLSECLSALYTKTIILCKLAVNEIGFFNGDKKKAYKAVMQYLSPLFNVTDLKPKFI